MSAKRFFPLLSLLLLFLISFSATAQYAEHYVIERNGVTYRSNELIIKLKEQPAADSKGNIDLKSGLLVDFSQFEPRSARFLMPHLRETESGGIGNIIDLTYDSDIDPIIAAAKIMNLPYVEWAEPRFVYETDFTPNDPNFASQWNLSKINAAAGWDITQGSPSVIIGIVDTGVDHLHSDLNANIWVNPGEVPDNGVDDDGNGFIDDNIGWDFGGLDGTPDNDPREDQPDHGTHVAGIAGAVTNNGNGIASIGFKSKIMAIKTSQNNDRSPTSGQPYIIYGYEGIIYAADNGAKIINTSWGGGGYSILGQETIDYALSKGSLVVGAAGNSGLNTAHYPSGYKGVISVGSTNQTDSRSGFSNYGITVDVMAPGEAIFSTWQSNGYISIQGTSMASPLAAGLAALIAAQFPGYTPLQIGEQLRVTTDDISSQNPGYDGLIGSGRINAPNALQNSGAKSVRIQNIQFTDANTGNNNGVFEPGETIEIRVAWKNYLAPTSNLTVSVQSSSPHISIVNGSFNAGGIGTLGTTNNYASPFTFTISNSAPEDTEVELYFSYTDGGYSDYEWGETTLNQTYATQFGNNIALTITGLGTQAFNDYPDNLQGEGCTYDGSGNLLFEGALMIGQNVARVSDCARGNNQSAQRRDFGNEKPFLLRIPGLRADVEGEAFFNDEPAGINRIGVGVKLYSYSFGSQADEDYLILKYAIKNTKGSQIDDIYIGLFYDWDLGNSDKAEYDNTGNFGYTYHMGGNPDMYMGVALLSHTSYGYWAIQNNGQDGGFGIYDGFSDPEKYESLSSGLGKTTAGPGDVSQVVSAGPFTLAPDEEIVVAFAVAGGYSLEELRTAVSTARTKYLTVSSVEDETVLSETPVDFNLAQNYPNPFNPVTTISYSIPEASHVSLTVYDVAGNEVAELVNGTRTAGAHLVRYDASELASGIYFYRLQTGSYIANKKMLLLK